MAGAMRKAMVYLGLVEEDDRYDYDEYDDGIEGDADGYDQRADHHDGGRGAHRTAGATALREERHGAVATMPERRPSAVVARGRSTGSRRSTRAPTTRPSRSARASARARRSS